MNKNQIKELLKSKKISITQSRIDIINCLNDDVHFHTVKDILEHSNQLNTKSIYNNLKVLIEEGLIETYSFNGISKYALTDSIINEDLNNQIHVMGKKDVIDHHPINEKIINEIKKELNNHKIKKIKIFVEVEE